MLDFNSPLIGLVVRIIGVAIFLYILYLQLKANSTPQDAFTPTRNILTVLISSIIIFTAPSICYLFMRTIGIDNELLRAVSTVCASFSFIFTAVLLLILYIQKVERNK